jgi:hypothetical protein
MTQIHFQETEGIGPSARVWKKINCPHSSGFFRTRGEGNPALGFYDDFIKTSDTSLEDGYIRLQTATGTVTQVASEATAPGIVQLATPADNDEAVIQLGNGIDVGPFRLQKDFAFEARIRVDAEAIVAGDHSFFIGMASGGSAGGAIANKLFTASDVLFVTTLDAVGFYHLAAESTAMDACYLAQDNGTTVDGSVDTDLDTVQTLVAATWYKFGFRFQATRPRKMEWFVDGVKQAEILETAVAAAAFPDADDAWLQPTFGARGADATAATMDIDWWACAQLY